jgi:membrane fusion protein (multidrug efflux system)
MAKRLFIVIVALLIVLGGLGGLWFMNLQKMIAQFSQPMPPATVASAEVRAETWQRSLRSVGSLVAENGVTVTPELGGVVREISFNSGGTIEAGDVLIRLDDRVDRAALEALRADRRLAEIRFKRTTDLLRREAISKSEYDEARANFDAANARVVQQEETLAKKTVRAPFSGSLGIRAVNVGQFVEPGDPIVTLQSLDPIYVDYALPERELARAAVGQQVVVRVDAYPGETFTGTLEAIATNVEAATRSLSLRATLPNPDGRLRNGMFAEVETLLPAEDQVLTIPRTAVSFNTYGDFVFVIAKGEDGGMLAQQRQIGTGETRGGRVEVLRGLEAGEQVVRAGLVKLREGQSLQIDNSVELRDGEITQP